MVRGSALTSILVAATAFADTLGLHEAAFYLLTAAVPVAAVAALMALGDLLDGETSDRVVQLRVLLSGLALVWVVIAAAVRSAAVDDGSVPPAAASALVVCLAVLALQIVTAFASSSERTTPQSAAN